MPRALLAILPAAALVVCGCAVGDDGPSTTQTRNVAAFTRVDNHDSVEVRLRVGAPQRVIVRAGDKVIDNVHTEVRDGTLHVSFDHRGFGGDDVVLEGSVPTLTGIQADGSGRVAAAG